MLTSLKKKQTSEETFLRYELGMAIAPYSTAGSESYIVSIFFRSKLHKSVALMQVAYSVLGDIDIGCKDESKERGKEGGKESGSKAQMQSVVNYASY